MKQTTLFKFWDFLNMVEDYYTSGYRRQRPNIGIIRFFTTRDTSWNSLRTRVRECNSCTRVSGKWVPPEKAPGPDTVLMVITDGLDTSARPNAAPLAGPEIEYLDKWLAAIELDREKDCYLTSLLKCALLSMSSDFDLALSHCVGFLKKEIDAVKPKAILTIGRAARQVMDAMTISIPRIHTHHPAEVLKNSRLRAVVWDDLKRLKVILAK
ncbi:MAG: hypothetical protein JW969_05025 [Spirochaetales bacterium]|nr:hypothetical protein [Spirochaetales bacterium]